MAIGDKRIKQKAEAAFAKMKSSFPSPVRIIEGKKSARAGEDYKKTIKNLKWK